MDIPESEKKVLAAFKFPVPMLVKWTKINRPHVGFFVKNGHITRLTLRGLKLTALPDSIGNLKKLRVLLLSNNQLNHLPESFQYLINLEVLALGTNNFNFLPEWFGNLENLQSVSVGYNKLHSLPKSFRHLVNLRILHLGANNFNFLPEWFGNLENLQSVVLSNNKISILPESFRNLKNLKGLSLIDTGLRSFSNIPKEFIDSLNFPDVSWPWPDFLSKGNHPSKEAQEIIGSDIMDFMVYFRVSPLELAQKYAKDQNSLSAQEKDRLAWEGGFRERDVIEMKDILFDDPILTEISNRLFITCNNGLELIK